MAGLDRAGRATGPSPDDPVIAVVGAEGSLTLVTAEGDPVDQQRFASGLLTAGWSPDGRTLAVGTPNSAAVWDIPGARGSPRSRLVFGAGLVPVRAVGGGRRSRSVAIVDADGALVWRTAELPSTVTSVHWLRDGREVLASAYGGARVFGRGRPGAIKEWAYAGSLLATAVSPGDRWLVSGNQDASLHVWRLRDGTELGMSGLEAKVTTVAFDSSGRWLAADGSGPSTVWDFSGKGPGGTSAWLLEAHPGGPKALSWHPTLPWLATGGTDGRVCPVACCPRWSGGKPSAPTVSLTDPSTVPVTRAGVDGERAGTPRGARGRTGLCP